MVRRTDQSLLERGLSDRFRSVSLCFWCPVEGLKHEWNVIVLSARSGTQGKLDKEDSKLSEFESAYEGDFNATSSHWLDFPERNGGRHS